MERLQPTSPSPPHPSLVLAMVPMLMPLSPSPVLRRTAAFMAPLEHLVSKYSQQGLSTLDHRLTDIIIARYLFSYHFFNQLRLLEGTSGVSSQTSLVWTTGLGKMRGLGEKLIDSPPPMDFAEISRRRKNDKLVSLMPRNAVLPPPRDVKDYEQRVHIL